MGGILYKIFVRVYEEYFSRLYGFWRPYIEQVIYRYLDCGDPHNGFARVKCNDCGHEYLLAFSCKRRHFCPSCHQKRVVEFGERLCMDVLKKVPHRHFVFSIPKILRRYFLYDRKLLADLSCCAWESLKIFLQEVVPENDPIPGAVIAIQTFGDFLGFNPHCHILVTDGCFYGSRGMFRVAPPLELKKLESIFRHKVLKMLLSRGKITTKMIDMVRYYGYYSNVSRGKRQKEGNDDAVPCILESQGDEKTFRRNWARLIQKIYEVDPLVCPKCQGAMRVIGSIEDPSVIRAIIDVRTHFLMFPFVSKNSLNPFAVDHIQQHECRAYRTL